MEENFSEILRSGDYESEFEFDAEAEEKRKKQDDLISKTQTKPISKPTKRNFVEECCKEQGRARRSLFLSLDAYSRHKELINQYVLCYPGSTSKLQRDRSKDKTEFDVIKENHCFLWDDENSNTWGKQLARKYYDKLFKEYCLTDLTLYKENKIALRWRTKEEVINGKGQFICGEIKCSNKEEMRSWEVNFAYVEHGKKKNALVKVRLCPKCSYKLNYRHRKKEIIKITASEQSPVKQMKYSEGSDDANDNSQPSSSAAAASDNSFVKEDCASDKVESNIWKKPVEENVEITVKTRDDDFEQYLVDMLL